MLRVRFSSPTFCTLPCPVEGSVLTSILSSSLSFASPPPRLQRNRPDWRACGCAGDLRTTEMNARGLQKSRDEPRHHHALAQTCSPLLRREVVLALGVLVLNPAHFPFFVAVAQELSVGAAAAVEAAAAEGRDAEDGDETDGDLAGGKKGNGPSIAADKNGRRGGGERNASSPRKINPGGGGDGGGGGRKQVVGSLSGSPIDALKGFPSLWGGGSARLSSSVGSGGRNGDSWAGREAPTQQQLWVGGEGAEEVSSLPRGLRLGKLYSEDENVGEGREEEKVAEEEKDAKEEEERKKDQEKKPRLSEALLQALGGEAAQQYAVLWRVLEQVRDADPFPRVAAAAEAVTTVVVEQARAFAAVRRAALVAEEDEETPAPPSTTPGSLSSSADTKVMSWSSSSLSAPGVGAGGGLAGGPGAGPGPGGGGGPGLAGSWASTLQAVPPATCGLNQPHLLHAFYKWSCREFSEPVEAAPAQVVPDVAGFVAPPGCGKKAEHGVADASPPGALPAAAAAAAAGVSASDALPVPVGMPGFVVGPGWSAGGSAGAPMNPQKVTAAAAQKPRLPRQQRQQEQLHRHDPVDSKSYEGVLHLYLKDRNIRVHDQADVSRVAQRKGGEGKTVDKQ